MRYMRCGRRMDFGGDVMGGNHNHTIILDGGMGRALECAGAPFSQPFWSAQALMEAPDMVAQVHRDFIQAGAQVITTNSYAVVPAHIGADLFAQDGRALIRLAAELARAEADIAADYDGGNTSDNASDNTSDNAGQDAAGGDDGYGGAPVQVAACVPPVFGSYQPDQFDAAAAPDLLAAFFEEQAPYADLFLAETISALEEARILQDVYQTYGYDKPLWLSFTLQERFDETAVPHLRSGERLDAALQTILDDGIAAAVLLNCCAVEDISAAFTQCGPVMDAHQDVQFGAYANAFGRTKGSRSPTDGLSVMRDDIAPETYLDYARQWQQNGARIIGGCCGVGPDYIALLSTGLKA